MQNNKKHEQTQTRCKARNTQMHHNNAPSHHVEHFLDEVNVSYDVSDEKNDTTSFS